MYQTALLLIAGVLTLPLALSIPCVNPQPGSTSCQVLGDAPASVPDGPTAVAGWKMNAPARRGRPIPTHVHEEPAGITRPTLEGPSGIFRGQDHDEMGPFHLSAGTYQIYIQWIGDFVPGKSKHRSTLPYPTLPYLPHPLPSSSISGKDEVLHHVRLADENLPAVIATLWVMPGEDDASANLLDIVTCPGTSLNHPLHASRPVEFDLHITDDYGMPDGSFDRRPSRAKARWWIAAEGLGVEVG